VDYVQTADGNTTFPAKSQADEVACFLEHIASEWNLYDSAAADVLAITLNCSSGASRLQVAKMLLAVKRALNLNRCNRSCDDLFVCSRQEFKEIDGIRLGCIKLEKG
jgi:hypothetical protein